MSLYENITVAVKRYYKIIAATKILDTFWENILGEIKSGNDNVTNIALYHWYVPRTSPIFSEQLNLI